MWRRVGKKYEKILEKNEPSKQNLVTRIQFSSFPIEKETSEQALRSYTTYIITKK